MNDGESIQYFHPLVLRHVALHHDGNMDESDKLFGFVSTPVEVLRLSCSGAPQQVAPSCSWQIGEDCLHYGQCGFGGCISDIALCLQTMVFKGVVGCLKLYELLGLIVKIFS